MNFTVTEDELLQVMDGVKEVYDAYYGGAADALKLKLGDDFSQLRDRACSMGDINVKVYVYQNKLARLLRRRKILIRHSTCCSREENTECRIWNCSQRIWRVSIPYWN